MRIPALLLPLLLVLLPLPAGAQTLPTESWNGERALELIRRAQQRRAEAFADTGLVSYRSEASIYVYFYLDREDTGERNLVKTDQLALEVLWQAPDQVKQRIVGWRDEKSLPTNINYHLDHLTVVQENFGDEIRLGDGDEVRGVFHPAAVGAHSFYEYLLTDSLTLRLPGAEEPVRVYELRVRPRDPSQPALVGSVFVDRRAGDIVRMDFTFTAAAYVDRYLDYINISLDNGLWRGRFWLPNQQRVEIRRRIPQLDIPAGSVIRANMRIGNYEFNQPISPLNFVGPSVVTVPRAQREAFDFERGLFDEVREEGLGPEVELRDIRRMAAEMAREQALRRVSRLRLRIPRASEVLRYNRAEGLALGMGVATTPVPGLRLGAHGGFAFGAEHPLASLSAEAGRGATRLEASAYLNRPRDMGMGPVISGTVNTLSSLVGGDYTDLYFADGVEVGVSRRLESPWTVSGRLRAERQRGADLVVADPPLGGDFRPVRTVDDTDLFVGGTLAIEREVPAGTSRWWTAGLSGELATLRREVTCTFTCRSPRISFLRTELSLARGIRWEPRAAELVLRARVGATAGEIPPQELYLLGGRGTIPGYRFRGFGGDRFATASATASGDLWSPWLRGRALGALGWSGVGDPGRNALSRGSAETTGGVKPSLGVGVGLFHDILRLDVARGLGEGGVWELIVEANPSFWDFL